MRSLEIIDNFSKAGSGLRAHFESVFNDPRVASGERFAWDYWHVEGQYTHLRTPAYAFFPKKIYEQFHQELVWWGRRNLGCHDVSPTWLSCYVDGCEQRLHADIPHGPWAFVYSLTPWTRRKFRGGETLLLREEILDYWSHSSQRRGLEEAEVFREVAPRFGRLLTFDPRVPHGVRRVEGVRDVREGRLVVHGWFVNPRPFVEGPLPMPELSRQIAEWTNALEEVFRRIGGVDGVLSINFRVTTGGEVTGVKVLTDSLRSVARELKACALLRKFLVGEIGRAKFSRKARPSLVTIPFVFSAEAPA